MAILDYVISGFKGASVIFVFGLFIWIIYIMLRALGITKLFPQLFKSKKYDESIYQEVANRLVAGEKFEDIMQSATRFNKSVQQKYIQAYIEVQEELKGGKDEKEQDKGNVGKSKK